MHRDPRFWADAGCLSSRVVGSIPLASLDEKAPGRPRAAWFPFGFASRKCIGDRFALAEAVLALATLRRTWDVIAKAPADVISGAAITLRPW